MRLYLLLIVLFTFLCTTNVCAQTSGTKKVDKTSTHRIDSLEREQNRQRRLLGEVYKYVRDTNVVRKSGILDDAILIDSIDNYVQNYRPDTTRINRNFTQLILSAVAKYPNNPELRKENRFEDYKDKVIDSIYIVRQIPFDTLRGRKFIRVTSKIGNTLHVLTREKRIMENLIVKPGQRVSPTTIMRNEVILSNLSYLSSASILIDTIAGSDKVNLFIYTKDNFSIGASADYHGKSEDSYVSLYDNNFLGYGNRLEISDRFSIKEGRYFKGGVISHDLTNILGTFYNLKTTVGYGTDFLKLEAESHKDFITPHDYAGGARYLLEDDTEWVTDLDSLYRVRKQLAELWAGHSFRVTQKETNMFFTLGGQYLYHEKRPFTNAYTNPFYHNYKSVLGSVGFYKEHFYRANMIYGFGYIENIPYGFKAEATAGYMWGEYSNMPYVAAKLRWGHRTLLGYFNMGVEMGAFINGINTMQQTIFNADLLYFTHLIALKKNYNLRFFIKSGTTIGNNMLNGERQRISLSGDYRLRGIGTGNNIGTSRFYGSLESVLFSPWHVWGFRFAIFGYSDMGTIGYNSNPFKNSFYNSVGLGVRIRNENLVFKTIQLRLSYMVRGNSGMSNNWAEINSESKLQPTRFTPESPKFIYYD